MGSGSTEVREVGQMRMAEINTGLRMLLSIPEG